MGVSLGLVPVICVKAWWVSVREMGEGEIFSAWLRRGWVAQWSYRNSFPRDAVMWAIDITRQLSDSCFDAGDTGLDS